jgi:hypothetical protein
MRAFVRIGRIKGNKSGLGSRAWCIERRGKLVWTSWGAVEVVRRSTTTLLRWAAGWPKEKQERCSTVNAANALIRQRIAEQTGSGASGKYERLKPGLRIYRRLPRA